MKQKLTLLLSFLTTLMVAWLVMSCDGQGDVISKEINDLPQLRSDLLSDKEAVDQALNTYVEIFGNKLRAMKVPQVSCIQRSSTLRSVDGTNDNQNAGIIVVNFKDDRGYVVLSESKYNEPIICVNDKGNLDITINTENSNLFPVLSNTDAILEFNHEHMILTDLYSDDDTPSPDEPLYEDYEFYFGPWERVDAIEPLVKVEWNQGAPHNAKLQPIEGELPPVGCVATAISQIMSFHKYPKYNWDIIIENIDDPYSKEILSTLHKDLGKPENLNMKYGIKSSGASSLNVPRTLRTYGYQSSSLIDYDFKTIKSEISALRPVYISACSFKHIIKTPRFLIWGGKPKIEYSGGHAWVLDGFIRLKREVKKVERFSNTVVDVTYQTKELVHCNFGWGGYNNGYYLSKAFNGNEGPVMRSVDGNNDDITYGEKYNYQFNHKIINNIKKK